MARIALFGLACLSSSAFAAAVKSREWVWGDLNQVNYYSDPRCKSYAGTWNGPDKMYQNAEYDAGSAFIGNVLVMPSNNFDSVEINGKGIVAGGLCPGDSQSPILIDASGFPCYVINNEVSKVDLYTAVCAIIPSSKE
ncbi:hypothetical protein FDECE_5087 [Fusarium decemcellulare]|nr:hypothetical protein FDECE_5087 [Fusarium decemcellulare]